MIAVNGVYNFTRKGNMILLLEVGKKGFEVYVMIAVDSEDYIAD